MFDLAICNTFLTYVEANQTQNAKSWPLERQEQVEFSDEDPSGTLNRWRSAVFAGQTDAKKTWSATGSIRSHGHLRLRKKAGMDGIGRWKLDENSLPWGCWLGLGGPRGRH